MHNPIRLGVIPFAVSTILSLGVMAQSPPSAPRPLGAPPVQPNTAQEKVIAVEFAGGTVMEYIEAVKAAAKQVGLVVNVICPAEARSVTVPSISVSSVTAETAMEALAAAFSGNAECQFRVTPVGVPSITTPTFGLQYARNTPPQIKRQPGQPQGMTGNQDPDHTNIEVLAIRDLIEPPVGTPANDTTRVTRETLIQAVNAAFSLEKNDKPPEVLFHTETGLLIIRGTDQQTSLAISVLNTIRKDLMQRRIQSSDESAKAAKRGRLLSSMETRLNVTRAEVEAARLMLERKRKLQSMGGSPPDGIAFEDSILTAELELTKSEARFKEAVADFEYEKNQAAARDTNTPSATGDAVPVEMAQTTYQVHDLHAPIAELSQLILLLGGANTSVTLIPGPPESLSISVRTEATKQAHVKLLLDTIRASKPESGKAAPAPDRAR